MTRQIRRSLRHDDSGASLAMALIFVAVVAVVIGTVLTFADVNFRTTSALRDQAEASAAADGAGQLAVNALRKNLYAGTGDCLGPSNTLLLPSTFYDIPSGGTASAAVTCDLDEGLSVSDGGFVYNNTNRPDNALEARRGFGTIFNPFEGAINIRARGDKSILVKGPIASNDTIDVDEGFLRSSSTIKARRSCTPGRVISTPPPATCGLGSDPGENPNYPLPSNTTSRNVPACNTTNTVITFQPGRYSGNAVTNQLNNMTRALSQCRGSTFYFPPGIYVFNLTDTWTINTGTVIAGLASSGANPGVNPTVPGACKSAVPPIPVPAGGWTSKQLAGDGGTTFVFQGASRLDLQNTEFEICAPYSTTTPPLAFVAERSGAFAQIGCVLETILTGGCPIIRTRANTDRFVVQGTTFLPLNALDLNIAGTSIQQLRAGSIVRSLHIDSASNAALGYNVFELPDASAGAGLRTVVSLNVFVCPGKPTCTASSGTLRLKAKVALNDPSGTPVVATRTVTVLNWNVMR